MLSLRSNLSRFVARPFFLQPKRAIASDSFANTTNGSYGEAMEELWRKDPNAVPPSWRIYFSKLASGAAPEVAFQLPGESRVTGSGSSGDALEALKLSHLIRAYQIRGHEFADTDPIKLNDPVIPEEAKLETYGYSAADLGRKISIPGFSYLTGFMGTSPGVSTLGELVTALQKSYCGKIGFEYMHISSREQCNWLRQYIESPTGPQIALTKDDKLRLLDASLRAHVFEETLRKKYPSQKGFGLEGAWSFIPGVNEIIRTFQGLGGEHVIMGMPHRGRLCFLAEIMGKPREALFKEFNDGGIEIEKVNDDFTFMGDVKYHLGCSTSMSFPDRPNAAPTYLTLLPNPSHLEAVYPVVEGKTRARQEFMGDTTRTKAMSVVMHGDASFAGQGVVTETMELSGLAGFNTGGTIHIIINNRIGFTTNPRDARTSLHPTDFAKAIHAPVLHVNGDDVEAVAYAAKLAVEWRQKWHTDVVIDIVCYRRNGHNEGDQPQFTQPRMYGIIEKATPTLDIFARKLISEGVLTAAEFEGLKKAAFDRINAAHAKAPSYVPPQGDVWGSAWDKMWSPKRVAPFEDTSVKADVFKRIFNVVSTYPKDFDIHPKLVRIFSDRVKAMETGKGIDWGTAEALAFGTLLDEGYHVRLSGQDVQRGTFSHRHAVIESQEFHGHDHPKGRYTFLKNIGPHQGRFDAICSSLSEYGVLGFEYGYSLENPQALVLWEAQFGDFVNGAQIIVDQFVTCGESKWRRQSNLVMLLPHGYEHGGPEHSSCRPERFLQNYDDDPDMPPAHPDLAIQAHNFQLVNCTTPSQYFHLLRRQVHRKFRKPLIVVAPKKLLRHPLATSSSSEFTSGGFVDFFDEADSAITKVRRVIFCTGKVYYDLIEARAKANIKDIAICRLEQLAPFPYAGVQKALAKYANVNDFVFCQEEPRNQGFYSFVEPRMRNAANVVKLSNFRLSYAGRKSSPSPAIGNAKESEREQAALIAKALQ